MSDDIVCDLVVDDAVVWTHGAVGLRGVVTGVFEVPDACPRDRWLLQVKTPKGVFCEYAYNLARG